jgi:uncharacterized membrane protein
MTRIDPAGALLAGVSILYPLTAALAVRWLGPGWVVLALCALLAARALIKPARRAVPAPLTLGLLAVAATIGLVALRDQTLAVRLYPACMNAAMLAAFGASLIKGPSMIERFARIAEPELPETAVAYTRRVTWVWVGFFIVNGSIAAWTAFYADWSLWTLYNGLITYIAIGALFVGELLTRTLARRRAAGHS